MYDPVDSLISRVTEERDNLWLKVLTENEPKDDCESEYVPPRKFQPDEDDYIQDNL